MPKSNLETLLDTLSEAKENSLSAVMGNFLQGATEDAVKELKRTKWSNFLGVPAKVTSAKSKISLGLQLGDSDSEGGPLLLELTMVAESAILSGGVEIKVYAQIMSKDKRLRHSGGGDFSDAKHFRASTLRNKLVEALVDAGENAVSEMVHNLGLEL